MVVLWKCGLYEILYSVLMVSGMVFIEIYLF